MEMSAKCNTLLSMLNGWNFQLKMLLSNVFSLATKNISSANSDLQLTSHICNQEMKCSKFGRFSDIAIPFHMCYPFSWKNNKTLLHWGKAPKAPTGVSFFVHLLLIIFINDNVIYHMILWIITVHKITYQGESIPKSREFSNCVLFLQRKYLALCHPPISSHILRKVTDVCQ